MDNKKQQNSVDLVIEDTITSLIYQGKHEEAWEYTLDLDEIFRLYHQIQISLDQGKLIESLKLLQQAIKLTHNQTDPKIKDIWYKLKLYQIAIQMFIDPRKGIEYFNEFRDIPQKDDEFTLGMTNLISGMINNDPNYYQASIDHLISSEELTMLELSYTLLFHLIGANKALEQVDNAIRTFKHFGHKNKVSVFTCFKGSLYQVLGNYKEARLLNIKAFEECSRTNFVHGVANANICLGAIAIEEGNISEAIKRLEPSSKIFYQNFGYYPGISILIEAYRYSGMYNQGLKVSLDNLEQMKIFSPTVYERLFIEITLLVLAMDKLELAKELYERFKSIAGTVQDSTIENSLKFCEALILKQSKSMGTAYKAQIMMRELLKTTALSYPTRTEIIKQLCELLLLEYELYEQKEILIEVQEYINFLSNIAQEQNLIRLTFEAGIISSKLELLKKDFGNGRKILVNLRDYAKSKGLSVYEQVVSKEIAFLDENYAKWFDLVESNVSLREFMEKTKIKNYMTNALKQIDVMKLN